jgi:hypothetical protein
MLLSKADVLHEVLNCTATLPGIDNFVNEEFLNAIFSDNWLWPFNFTTREKLGIVRNVSFEET